MAAARVSVLLQCAATDSRRPATFPFCSLTHSRLNFLPDWRQSFHINKRSFNVGSQSRKTPLPSSCPSVCPHVSAVLSMDGYSKIWCWGNFMTMSRNSIFGYEWTKTCVLLHGQLRTFHGCRQRKFAFTATLYQNTQYFSISASNTDQQHTLKEVFRVDIATVLTRSHFKLPLILLSSLKMLVQETHVISVIFSSGICRAMDGRSNLQFNSLKA